MSKLRDYFDKSRTAIENSTFDGQFLGSMSREELMTLAYQTKHRYNKEMAALREQVDKATTLMYQAERQALADAGFVTSK